MVIIILIRKCSRRTLSFWSCACWLLPSLNALETAPAAPTLLHAIHALRAISSSMAHSAHPAQSDALAVLLAPMEGQFVLPAWVLASWALMVDASNVTQVAKLVPDSLETAHHALMVRNLSLLIILRPIGPTPPMQAVLLEVVAVLLAALSRDVGNVHLQTPKIPHTAVGASQDISPICNRVSHAPSLALLVTSTPISFGPR